LALLSETAKRGDFPFREVAERFRIIKDGQQTVIVPQNEEASRLANSLAFAEHAGGILRRLQRHTVQVHPTILSSLVTGGAVEMVANRYAVLRNTDIYSDDLGLCPEDPHVPGSRKPDSVVEIHQCSSKGG
jgi:CRISPR-associated endonuclease/helicase Cas3